MLSTAIPTLIDSTVIVIISNGILNNPSNPKTETAPNKLGIYVDKKHANKLHTLKQMEVFKILFGYNCPDIYFKYSPNKIVRKFCDSKEVNINNVSLRYTV